MWGLIKREQIHKNQKLYVIQSLMSRSSSSSRARSTVQCNLLERRNDWTKMPQTCYYVTSKTDVYILSISCRLVCFVTGDDEVNDLPQTVNTHSFTCILLHTHTRGETTICMTGKSKAWDYMFIWSIKFQKLSLRMLKMSVIFWHTGGDPVHVSEVRVEEDIDSRE